MKLPNAALIFLFLLFSMVGELQALQPNGYLPQCPNTAPQAVIQAIAAPQGQGINNKRLVVKAVLATATATATAIIVGIAAGHRIQKAFINVKILDFLVGGGVAGAIVGEVVVTTIVVFRCVR